MKKMMKKPYKVKTPDDCVALIEYMTSKRIKYLEYIIDLHSNDGGLWMNSVQLNKHTIGRHFQVPEECLLEVPDPLSPAPGSAAAAVSSFSSGVPTSFGGGSINDNTNTNNNNNKNSALEVQKRVTNANRVNTQTVLLLLEPQQGQEGLTIQTGGDGSHATTNTTIGDAADTQAVNLSSLPPPRPLSHSSNWPQRYLPSFTALALSLSDLMLVPISGAAYIEAVYGLLLEVEVAFAGGPAARAIAQHQLRQFRQHLSPELLLALRGADAAPPEEPGAPPSANNAATAATMANASLLFGDPEETNTNNNNNNSAKSSSTKYLFLNLSSLGYTAAPPSYDAVVPALCSVLVLLYRRVCDFEAMRHVPTVKRVLSIDKRLRKLVLEQLSDEWKHVAQRSFMQEAFVLSQGGLFKDLYPSSAANAVNNNNNNNSMCGAIPEEDYFMTEVLKMMRESTMKQEGRGSGGVGAAAAKVGAAVSSAVGAASGGGSSIGGDDVNSSTSSSAEEEEE